MRKTTVIVLFLFNLTCLCAQNQRPQYVHWDGRFGGTLEEVFSTIFKLPNGKYILAGFSRSGQNGNKSSFTKGGADYWILQIDQNGNKLWEKAYGTNSDDRSFSTCFPYNGGFLMAGHTAAGISGDKTEPSRGNSDYWVIRLDSLGNKFWDKTFGGNSEELLNQVIACSDGGFMLIGSSNSNASGDKSEDNAGPQCGWVVKIDSLGNKQWDQTFKNGVMDEVFIHAAIEVDDGYLFGGATGFGAQNDVTQTGYGGHDYWLIKTDFLGNTLWDKRYGGGNGDQLYQLVATNDGAIILCGTSFSGISGIKTSATIGYWLLKIDSIGNVIWQNTFEYLAHNPEALTPTSDGGFLFSTWATYHYTNEKTEPNLGNGQTWILKIDSLGQKVWDKTIFTTASNAGYAIEVEPGCYIIGTSCKANAGGYKSQDNWDSTLTKNDFWILKLCEEPLGVEEPTQNFATLYPNPTTGTLHIETTTHTGHVTLYNLLGGEVVVQPLTNTHTTLDVSLLPPGVYLYKIEVEGKEQTGKVVVQ